MSLAPMPRVGPTPARSRTWVWSAMFGDLAGVRSIDRRQSNARPRHSTAPRRARDPAVCKAPWPQPTAAGCGRNVQSIRTSSDSCHAPPTRSPFTERTRIVYVPDKMLDQRNDVLVVRVSERS